MGIDYLLLGPLEVRLDGEPVTLGGPKQRALLAVLLLRAGAPVSVDRLVDDIWGPRPPGSPERSIQVYVSELRSLLGPYGGALVRSHAGYRLDVGDDGLDVRRFERSARDARGLLDHGDAAAATEVAGAALELWRGPLLADLDGAGFATAHATRLDALRLETHETRTAAELALGRHHTVVGDLETLVEEHPERESLRAQLMLALHRCGRQVEALAAYDRGRRWLRTELGLDPGGPLRDLHAAVLRDDPALRIEPAELRERRHLPTPATPLIGRRTEIDELIDLLRGQQARLVTTTGPGGIGKTRVGVQVAHELADAFTDGVYFVGLAELRDPQLVVPTIAAALGVEEAVDEPLLATLERHLERRRLLLLLDNFEHVDEAAPVVSRLLAAARDLKVLVTSRSRLHLYGEHEYRVGRLQLESEAVPLFEARAKAATADFRLTDDRADTVRRICERLDCLALAVELAAARVAELSLEQMLQSLPMLELAASGPRDLSTRQRTLRAAIDWSYRLLPPAEQVLFARVSVFVGGCTQEAVQQVCAGDNERLRSLVASNLVLLRPTTRGERFDQLETIREFAVELLASADPVRDRHAQHYLALAEEAADGVRGPDQLAWVSRLDAERDNIRAALTHLLRDGRSDGKPRHGQDALRLASALGFYWYKTGAAGEGAAWLDRALAAAPGAPDPLRARALHALGVLVAERGDPTHALACCEASCALFRQTGDLPWVARSLNSQAGILRDRGDGDRAERLFQESVDIRRHLGQDDASVAVVLGNLAIVALDRNDLARARSLGEECLEMSRDTDPWVHAATLQLLADVAVHEHDTEQARALLRRAVPMSRGLGAYRLIECLDTCAGVATRLGRYELAAELVGAADAALDDLGAHIVPADVRMRERRIADARRALGDDRFEAARADGRAVTLEQALERASIEVIDTG